MTSLPMQLYALSAGTKEKVVALLKQVKRAGYSKDRATEAFPSPVFELALDTGLIEYSASDHLSLTMIGRQTLKVLLSSAGLEEPQYASPVGSMGVKLTDLPQVSLKESPLQWLASRRDRHGQPMVTSEQVEAGERLRTDFTRACLGGITRSNWRTERLGSSYRQMEESDYQLDARRRFYDALDAVGPELSSVLVDVCCHLNGLAATEKKRGWPERTAKVVLCLALDRLYAHYLVALRASP
ncbi:hypothetical protein E1162_17005 [Rhodobacteraceae bacterium RKSG542]|uniref:DUF6456 domain-containing protein n=1 Tax=Pseudovibrio flavus TaxID=2529854 RepID=UPI0012BC6E5E|nr:DUF6456 domain-containing protein [Pseudovibrio flavus]MTI18945.1 hypothetical protein [Pseudovibrio flavus]